MQSEEWKDLSKEEWREYRLIDSTGCPHDYKIVSPLKLWVGTTSHRILDSAGIVHCVPSVGVNATVLRWKPKDVSDPVQF